MTQHLITGSVGQLAEVEERIGRLYREAIGAQTADETVPVVRIALCNLVAYVRSEERASGVVEDTSRIVGAHPCRAIVVDAMPPLPGEEHTSVSVVCAVTGRGDRRVCGEIIRVHAHQGRGDAVGSIMPLLTPDVPLIVWVPEETALQDAEFEELSEVADGLVVDSREWSNLPAALVRVLALAEEVPQGAQDLGWTALERWRELTAEHFDPHPARACLDSMERIVLEYADAGAAPPSIPLLFASWLIDRTGLDIADVGTPLEGCLQIRAMQGGRPVDVALTSRRAAGEPGRLLQVTIVCSTPDGQATFTTAVAGQSRLSIDQRCVGICYPPRTVEIGPQDRAALVAEALDAAMRDPIYERAARLALDVLSRST